MFADLILSPGNTLLLVFGSIGLVIYYGARLVRRPGFVGWQLGNLITRILK
jgi:hypothetical protein